MEEISVSWFVVTVSSICSGIKNGIMSMDDLKYFKYGKEYRSEYLQKVLFVLEKAEGEGKKKVVKERKDDLGSLDCLLSCNFCAHCSHPLSLQFCEQCCHKKSAFCLKTCFLRSLS